MAVAISVIVANLIGKETAILVGNLGYYPITILLTAFTAIMVIKFRTKNACGVAWIVFLACATSWMVAKHV